VPELPEVETVRRQLVEAIAGAEFVGVGLVEPAMLRDCDPGQLTSGLPGRRVMGVGRLGKFIVLSLDGDAFLTLHLGMTGQILVDPAEQSDHTRFLFVMERSGAERFRLEFRDMRKFGRVHLTWGGPAPRLGALGPDAWLGEWDEAYLMARSHGRTAPLKAFLLDQRNLAGIGNIYADEILWWTGLSPLRPAGDLTAEEVVLLADEIRHRLGEGVELLGCSLSDFVDIDGNAGGFQEWLQAYGRQGEVCRRCGEVLVRAVVGGRGTAYCPGCQR
jgi:formamidopyrimidine-DNA glycosylase